MARVKRDKRYQLPKNRIIIPLIIYTLIFFIACGIISLSGDLIATYATKLKALNEVQNTSRYTKQYNDASEEELDEIFESFSSSGYTIFASDSKMNILRKNGEITAVLERDEKDDEDKEHRSFFEVLPTSDLKSNELGFLSNSYADEMSENFFLLPDKNNPYINVDDTRITPNLWNILEGALKNSIKPDTKFEYWTAYYVRNNTEILAFKTNFSFTYSDLAFGILYDGVSYILTVLIFALLVTNLIRTHRSNRQMRNLVLRDNITGNRNWFWFAMKSKEILKKRKAGVNYAVVSLIFVRYRNYVLCHSVDQGEQTLRLVWQNICAFLDKNEICSHGTINNFQILMKANSEDEARERLRRIIKSLEAIGIDHDFNFQAGVFMIPSNVRKNADIDLLYNNASAARMTLESTEESGIAFFDNKLVEDEKWIDLVTEHQKEAIEKEEFKVYYQPKYDPRTNEQLGAEALIRWVSDEMGFVPPGKFIPIFENSGFITEIDHYMLSHVARDQKKWLDEGRKCVPVSVNVSRAHFAEINLADQIRSIVDEAGAPHELIEIELTESAFFDDKKLMLYTINKLKKYGFLVSMDDFGSGYSSLNSLKDMPLNILKLDAGFFRGENDNERAEIVVSEILHLAKKLNMTTVAEGVDEQHQVDFLAAEGCNMIQGYYYSKPMPKEEYEAKMGQPAQVERQETEEPVNKEPAATDINIRLMEEGDAEKVSELIRTTISISNKKDYPEELMDQLIAIETPEHVLERASWTHFYVAEKDGAIIGCGAIGPYWGKEDESSLFTIFVNPEYQGKGVGRLIVETLEKDEYFLRAKRIEIPASITGIPFYLKMGYDYKNGITEPDEEHLIRLEKFRENM
jgi:EAL domain-containing protein (putative c-di-GMP-specific phosphodiesterase class I)/N-acetylglutamate synthase-like GNAT family acetyltransferase